MRWFYFDLVTVTDGYILVDEDEVRLQENGNVLIFANHDDANAYIVQNDIRGSIK